MSLFEELRQTSQEMFESESDPNVSWDVYVNSSKSGILQKMPLSEEFGRTSQEMFESDSDPNVSWDVYVNSSKSGISQKCALYIHNTHVRCLRPQQMFVKCHFSKN